MRTVWRLTIAALFVATPIASANYNSECLNLLLPPVPKAIEINYKMMVDGLTIPNVHVPLSARRLGAIDYETLYDAAHGLSLMAKFSDGSLLKVQQDKARLLAM